MVIKILIGISIFLFLFIILALFSCFILSGRLSEEERKRESIDSK